MVSYHLQIICRFGISCARSEQCSRNRENCCTPCSGICHGVPFPSHRSLPQLTNPTQAKFKDYVLPLSPHDSINALPFTSSSSPTQPASPPMSERSCGRVVPRLAGSVIEVSSSSYVSFQQPSIRSAAASGRYSTVCVR